MSRLHSITGRTSSMAVFAATAAATVFGACASTAESPAQDLPGCYYFQQDAVFSELRLPWGVRLADAPLQGWPALEAEGAHRATTLTGTREQDHPFGYWLVTAPDSVEIGYPGGGGWLLELHVQEDRSLTGTITGVGDAIDPTDPAPRQPRPVSMVWARCPGD